MTGSTGSTRFEPIAVSVESTVVAERVSEPVQEIAYQSGAALDRELIALLQSQAYEYLPLTTEPFSWASRGCRRRSRRGSGRAGGRSPPAPPFMPGQDLDDGGLRVVVPDLPEGAAEEREGRHVAGEEGFELLGGVGDDEGHPGVLGPQAEEEDALGAARDEDLRLAEVGLGHLAGDGLQGDEDLRQASPEFSHRPAHRHLGAGEVVFFDQAIVGAPRGVALFAGGLLVRFQPALEGLPR